MVYTGWSIKGKKFTKTQFNNSVLAENLNFDRYSKSFDEQKKDKKLRRTL
jgi:hypothetical protein